MMFDATRNKEAVSCKAALLSPDHAQVLLVEYLPGKYGLPGGHIEPGEQPSEAMRRELLEELGIEVPELIVKAAWRHPEGKLVIGYAGDLSQGVQLVVDREENQSAQWVSVADIRQGTITAQSYDEFIFSVADSL